MATDTPVSLITHIPASHIAKLSSQGKKLGWNVKVDGGYDTVTDHPFISQVELSSQYGVLRYGMTPGGYDGWSFHEVGGGGTVILPYAVVNGQPYVGLLHEKRHNQGGMVWNCPRGFLNSATENHFEAAQRELAEELFTEHSLDVTKTKVEPLDGEPGNCNSAFFETPSAGEGLKYFAAKFHPAVLQDDGNGGYVFKTGFLQPDSKLDAAQKGMGEKILKSRFVHWKEAARVSDLFTNAAVARLLAKLAK